MKDEILAKALSTDTEIVPRYDIVKPDGTKVAENAQLVLKNAVTQEGTALNKATLLTDETAAALGLGDNPTVDEALGVLKKDVDNVEKVGDIKTTVRTDLGDDWLLCNGEAVNTEEYPGLKDWLPVTYTTDTMSSYSDNAKYSNRAASIINNKFFAAFVYSPSNTYVASLAADETTTTRCDYGPIASINNDRVLGVVFAFNKYCAVCTNSYNNKLLLVTADNWADSATYTKQEISTSEYTSFTYPPMAFEYIGGKLVIYITIASVGIVKFSADSLAASWDTEIVSTQTGYGYYSFERLGEYYFGYTTSYLYVTQDFTTINTVSLSDIKDSSGLSNLSFYYDHAAYGAGQYCKGVSFIKNGSTHYGYIYTDNPEGEWTLVDVANVSTPSFPEGASIYWVSLAFNEKEESFWCCLQSSSSAMVFYSFAKCEDLEWTWRHTKSGYPNILYCWFVDGLNIYYYGKITSGTSSIRTAKVIGTHNAPTITTEGAYNYIKGR